MDVTQEPAYCDKRSEFWKRHFDMAQDYEAYLKQSSAEHVKRWLENAERSPDVTEEQRQHLQGYDRKLNVLMYAGVWCGDCARTGPMLKRIVDACGEKVKLKVIEQDASEELQDELRILGGLRTPVVVFLSEDWWEVDRFGDRTLSVYRSRAAREARRGLDKGVLSHEALATQLQEWVDIFERVLLMLRLAPFLRKRYGD